MKRRGVGADRYGNVYWVGDDGLSVWGLSCGDGVSSQLWPLADTAPAPRAGEFAPAAPQTVSPLALAGLAVTEDHYLLVGTQQPAGLLVFDLFGGGAPSLWRWPGQGTLQPWDMAPRPGGGVWLLDRQQRCYWEINRALQLCGASAAADPQQQVFQLARVHVAAETRYLPADEVVSAYALAAHIDPVAIEALPDGSVLILDRSDVSYSQILRFRGDVQLGNPISLRQLQGMIDSAQPESLQLLGHDITVAPGQDGALRLLVASASGNQSFEFTLTLTADDWQVAPKASFLPMRRFAGKGLLTARGQVYYDFGQQWVPLLAQSRPRYVDVAELVSANAGMSFDSNLPDCVWHRLVLDADALNAVAGSAALASALQARTLPTVLTPHPLEAARLLGCTVLEVQADRLRAAQQLAERFGCSVVLKGSGSVIASPGRTVSVCRRGSAALASAGTGDVLAGWLAGLWAPELQADLHALCGRAVSQHGAAGEALPLRASTLIERLSATLGAA